MAHREPGMMEVKKCVCGKARPSYALPGVAEATHCARYCTLGTIFLANALFLLNVVVLACTCCMTVYVVSGKHRLFVCQVDMQFSHTQVSRVCLSSNMQARSLSMCTARYLRALA